jgi:hypothetical protein
MVDDAIAVDAIKPKSRTAPRVLAAMARILPRARRTDRPAIPVVLSLYAIRWRPSNASALVCSTDPRHSHPEDRCPLLLVGITLRSQT